VLNFNGIEIVQTTNQHLYYFMQKYFITLLLLTSFPKWSSACTSCNKALHDSIYNSVFYFNLLVILSAFFVIAILVSALAYISQKKHNTRILASPHLSLLSPVPLTTAAMVLGIGLGGFIDGIVMHQILQWHEMLSNQIPSTDYIGKSVNMFWDGIFHAFCLLVVFTGVILLWKLTGRKDVDCSGKLFSGGLLTGWGLFNIVEGIIDHQILKLHNVVENSLNHDTANYIFLGTSVAMILTGNLIMMSHINKKIGKHGY
jgi:uncharacterized membrane protein